MPITNPNPPPPTILSDAKIVLHLPDSIGLPPANTPPPGVYQLRVGSDTAKGDAVTYRSNATPFSIAARVDVTTPPFIGPCSPLHTSCMASGFVAGQTQVLLDTLPLKAVNAPPARASFRSSAPARRLTFSPRALAAGPLLGARARQSGGVRPFVVDNDMTAQAQILDSAGATGSRFLERVRLRARRRALWLRVLWSD